MLAFMSSHAPATVHTPTDTTTAAVMSLAILPSQHMAYSERTTPTLLGPSPSPAKRPKLSLDTNSVPSIFGKASTSLRLETLSTTSPTARNTFRNALDAAHATSKKVKTPVLAPVAISTDAAPGPPSYTHQTPTSESAESSATTVTSASSIDSISSKIPYKLAFNATSILVNSPIPRPPKRCLFHHSRPMFPAPKKVAFREPLTEDVKTTQFTLRHSDIESSTSTIGSMDLRETAGRSEETSKFQEEQHPSKRVPRCSKASAPRAGDKRESSDEEDSDHDSCPATPVAGRRKRHRQWVWTLPPVKTNSAEGSPQREQGDVIPSEHVGSDEQRRSS